MSTTTAPSHAADRLLAAADRRGAPICVGLDPVIDRLPAALRPSSRAPRAALDAIVAFSTGVIDAVAEHAPVVKIQSACFERYRGPGVTAMDGLIRHAHGRDVEVILDAKRGDIGISAAHYAAAAFGGDAPADWVTVNAYLGADGVEPFLVEGRGAFALVRTSNPGADAVQERRLEDGPTVAEAMAGLVHELGRDRLGDRGYSSLGAVVGATRPGAAAVLRSLMPRQLFLVPGYGAQGGGADDVLPCFNADGLGAIVTASRSVIYAFEVADRDWTNGVRSAAGRMAGDLRRALGAP